MSTKQRTNSGPADPIVNKVFLDLSQLYLYMVQADPVDKLMRAALISDEEFVSTLNAILKNDLRISVRELSGKSGISVSSLYKILHGRRSPNLSTLREIIRALRQFYHVGN